jgi:hypothetical protein
MHTTNNSPTQKHDSDDEPKPNQGEMHQKQEGNNVKCGVHGLYKNTTSGVKKWSGKKTLGSIAQDVICS